MLRSTSRLPIYRRTTNNTFVHCAGSLEWQACDALL